MRKNRRIMLGAAALIAVIASYSFYAAAGLQSVEQADPVLTQEPGQCVGEKPGNGRGFCQISFCEDVGLRCENVSGNCPGECRYVEIVDETCTGPDSLPSCFTFCN